MSLRVSDDNPLSQTFDWYVAKLRRYCFRPLKKLAGNPADLTGPALLIYSFRHIMVAALLFVGFALFVTAMEFYGVKVGTEAGKTLGWIILIPLFVGLTHFSLESIRLLILACNGGRGQDELQGVIRTLVLGIGALMFFVGMFWTISAQIWLEKKFDDYKKHQQLLQEQEEYLSFLDKGKDAWNQYLNSTPTHYISFSGRNFDGRDMSGHDFHMVDFSGASLVGTNMSGCDLRFMKFDHADCRNASFQNSSLHMSSFKKARIDGADFTNAFINKSILAFARPGKAITENTRTDFDNFTPPR